MIDERASVLSAIPVFGDLADDVLDSLARRLTSRVLEPGEILVEQGERSDGLYILASGEVGVEVSEPDGTVSYRTTIQAPSLLGEFQAVVGGRRTATVSARSRARVEGLSKAHFEALVEAHPQLQAALSELVRTRLRHEQACRAVNESLGPLPQEVIEAVLERLRPLRFERGAVLFEQNDPGDCWYLIRSGAVRVHRGDHVLAELSAGDGLGALALLTGHPRSASATALDPTELLVLERDDYLALLREFPEALCARIASLAIDNLNTGAGGKFLVRSRIAVIGAAPDVAVTDLCRDLVASLTRLGPTQLGHPARLIREGIATHLHDDVPPDHPSWLRVRLWLEAQVEYNDFVVLAVEHNDSAWARLAVGWSSHLVIVGSAEGDPIPSVLERELSEAVVERHTLVVTYPPQAEHPDRTEAWLAPRRLRHYLNIRRGDPVHMDRLARFLVGRCNSLVLGGGGGRGLAHLGVFRALEEARIPIDTVCGVSIGALIGAQFARETPSSELIELTRKTLAGFRLIRPTLPVMSLLSNKPLRNLGAGLYGEARIEDTWRPFFCTSVSLTDRLLRIHDRGPIVHAALASAAVPGIAPPILSDGHLLVDGGVMNNLPADLARKRWGGTVIGVDVSDRVGLGWDGGELPSPWRVLWSKLLPWRKPLNVPGLPSIMLSAMNLGADERTLQAIEQADLLITPDVLQYGPGETKAIDDLIDRGFTATRDSLRTWTPPDPSALSGSDRSNPAPWNHQDESDRAPTDPVASGATGVSRRSV